MTVRCSECRDTRPEVLRKSSVGCTDSEGGLCIGVPNSFLPYGADRKVQLLVEKGLISLTPPPP